MNSSTSPQPSPHSAPPNAEREKAFTDSERLDWAIRYPYQLRELDLWCRRPENQKLAEIRKMIDAELRRDTKSRSS